MRSKPACVAGRRRRAFALGAVAAGIMTAAIVAVVAAVPSGPTPRIAVVASADPADSQSGELFEQGLVRAERDFDLEVDRRDPLAPGTLGTELAAVDSDLVILDPDASGAMRQAMFDPDKWYVLTDRTGAHFDDVPNVTTYSWADEQVGFLAGVAAATTTETGIVGFVGAEPSADQEELRAGFEAGASRSTPTSRSSPPISASPDSAAVHRSTHQTVPATSPVCSTTAGPM